jgi:hypothetical protein
MRLTIGGAAIHMIIVFAVFLIAVLVAFIAAEDRARQVASLTAFLARAGDAGRTLLCQGAEIIEHTAAGLASESRNRIGPDQLLRSSSRRTGRGMDCTSEP